MSPKAVDSRWFGLADLACAVGSAALVLGQPSLGGWPLLLAVLPWGWRLANRRFPFRRTPFDLPLAVFLLTALSGVWAAYNRDLAWDKFWVIVAAALLYYAIAGQPRENIWPLAGGLGALGAFISLYFFLAANWQLHPPDLAFLRSVSLKWMAIRPTLNLPPTNDNLFAGQLAMLFPFPLALGLRAWRKRQKLTLIYVILVLGVMGTALLMTSSRGAWLALAAGLGVWLVWGASGLVQRWAPQPRRLIFIAAMLVVGSMIVVALWRIPGGIVGLADRLPGLAGGTTRWQLAVNTYHLALDYPLTGGGLRAFEGLYSRYAKIIQVPEFAYSHNFYTDVLLEQGVFGFLMLLWMLSSSLYLLIAYPGSIHKVKPSLGKLRWAVAASIIALGLHSFVDDALYGSAGTPLLFLWTGVAIATTQPWTWLASANVTRTQPTWRPSKWTLGMGAAALVLLGVFHRPLLATAYDNLGAVEMSRIHLAGWPAQTEMSATAQTEFASTARWFEQALEMDTDSPTAHYRLGILAMGRTDYPTAQVHLQQAYSHWPEHRGVRKLLGYSLVWLGEIEPAVELLAPLPEAPEEMNTYAWWWGQQGHKAWADYSTQMAARLAAGTSSTSPSAQSTP